MSSLFEFEFMSLIISMHIAKLLKLKYEFWVQCFLLSSNAKLQILSLNMSFEYDAFSSPSMQSFKT